MNDSTKMVMTDTLPFYIQRVKELERERDEAITRTREAERALAEMTVTLCGSTRFKAAYIDWFQRLTDQGLIVLTVGRYLPKQDHVSQLKADLDRLHFRKIDLSSRILVLDVGGYIGDSTRNEIAYAERTGKQVEYLSQLCPDYVEPPLTETDIGRAVADATLARLKNPDEELIEAVGAYLMDPDKRIGAKWADIHPEIRDGYAYEARGVIRALAATLDKDDG